MKQESLSNGPLREAVFELFWEVQLDETGFPYDPEFDLAQGLFAKLVSEICPIHKRLAHPENLKIFPKPIHQFWKGELKWPVVQFGPGIIAINYTNDDYTWAGNFRPTIAKVIEILEESYEKKFLFKSSTLKYINVSDLSEMDYLSFISKNLLTEVDQRYELPGQFRGLTLSQTHQVSPSYTFTTDIQTVINNSNSKPAVMWALTGKLDTLSDSSEIISWLDEAHNNISTVFVNMINADFYASFTR